LTAPCEEAKWCLANRFRESACFWDSGFLRSTRFFFASAQEQKAHSKEYELLLAVTRSDAASVRQWIDAGAIVRAVADRGKDALWQPKVQERIPKLSI
jgi:hypothetical protein